MNLTVRKAVIPVAGLGTRFFPIAKMVPKEMLPVVDKPVIHYIVSEALDAGIDQIILISGRYKSAIEDYFDCAFELEKIYPDRVICSVRQKEALGLGHAILCAEPLVGNEPFAVLLGDDVILTTDGEKPAIRQLMEAFLETNQAQVAVMPVKPEDTDKYGIIEPVEDNGPQHIKVKRLVEKPPKEKAPSNLAVIGRYVLPPSIWPILRSLKPGQNDEIQLTDALDQLTKSHGLSGYRFTGQRIDTGHPLGLIELNLLEALRRDGLRNDLKHLLTGLVLLTNAGK